MKNREAPNLHQALAPSISEMDLRKGLTLFPNRRELVVLAGMLLIRPRLQAEQPWEGRRPQDWTPSDVQTILDRSAWASAASVEVTPAALDPDQGKSKHRVAAADGLRDKRVFPDYKILVRWESGLPVRLARHQASAVNSDFPRYVLSMSRLPIALLAAMSKPGSAGQEKDELVRQAKIAERVSRSSLLQCEGKVPLRADHAEWVASDFESRLRISFPHEHQSFDVSDQAVAFVTQIDELIFRASFLLRRMVYKDKLEL